MSKLLILNDTDDWILRKRDIRAWAQRGLWFAESGDVVIAMNELDGDFVAEVARLKGFDAGALTVHVLPANRFEGKMFDHVALYDPSFREQISTDLRGVDQLVALWPSPHIAAFAAAVGVPWAGQKVFEQSGCEFFNNMGNFKVFCASSGVPAARGSVVHTSREGALVMSDLLESGRAVMVKKAHGGAGAGNHIVTLASDIDVNAAGGLFHTVLSDSGTAVEAFWNDRWDWASARGAYGVVVEEFHPGARSVYAEHYCSDSGVALRAIGELVFDARRLVRETVPVVDTESVQRLIASDAAKLATSLWALGYRGPLSVDAVITPADDYFFTEVNAQYTGSTHLYSVLVERIAGEGRSVTQLTTPANWGFANVPEFLDILASAGCRFDPASRKGVLPVTPTIGEDDLRPLVLAVIHEAESEVERMLQKVDDAVHAVRP